MHSDWLPTVLANDQLTTSFRGTFFGLILWLPGETAHGWSLDHDQGQMGDHRTLHRVVSGSCGSIVRPRGPCRSELQTGPGATNDVSPKKLGNLQLE